MSEYPTCKSALDGEKGGRIIARICGNPSSPLNRTRVTQRVCRECQNPKPAAKESSVPPKPPSLIKRLLTYTEAVAEWIAAGQPERSDEEVQEIYDNHCKGCAWRTRKTDVCVGCGCRVAAYGIALTNKIKMATQHCPKERW